MLENLLTSVRGPPQQQQSVSSYGSAGNVSGQQQQQQHGITTSFDTVSNNPGVIDFEEDDLHQPSVPIGSQLRAMWQYTPRLKAVLPLATLPLALLFLLRDPLSSETASTTPWVPVASFFLALAAMVPCGVWSVELLEDLVVRKDSEKFGVLVNVVFEHLSEIVFCLWALAWRHHRSLCWVKPMLLGCVLFQLLVVLGGSILVAPESEERIGSSFGVSTWTTFSTGLVFSCAVFMIPTVYAQTITMPDLNSVILKNKISAQEAQDVQEAKLLFISRSLSVAVVAVYAVYLRMTFRSNKNYYTSAGNPNAPSTLSYALQYRASLKRAQEGRGHLPVGPRLSAALATCGATTLCLLQSALCFVVVRCLPATIDYTVLSLPFVLVILLPAVFEGGALAAALLMSRAGRLDIGASISFSGIVHLFLCVLPSIVLVAWVSGAPLELAFHPFLACTCFIAVLVVAQMVLVNRVRWLEGAMLVGLHVLVGCVCLLGGWHLCCGTETVKHCGN